jgi:hypothetical protein
MTQEQMERILRLIGSPNRANRLKQELYHYTERTKRSERMVAQWCISDLERGHTVEYCIGWLRNTK